MKKGLKTLLGGIVFVCLLLMVSYSRCLYIIKNTCLSGNWMATVNKKCISSEFENKINDIFSTIREKLEDPMKVLKWKVQNFFHI